MVSARNVWVLLYPAPDIEGQWVGHCLDLDVVAQGAGLDGAVRETAAAVAASIADDLEQGLDPWDRERAPDECWEPLYRLLQSKSRRSLADVPPEERARLALVAGQLRLQIDERPAAEPILEPWLMAATESSRHSRPLLA